MNKFTSLTHGYVIYQRQREAMSREIYPASIIKYVHEFM